MDRNEMTASSKILLTITLSRNLLPKQKRLKQDSPETAVWDLQFRNWSILLMVTLFCYKMTIWNGDGKVNEHIVGKKLKLAILFDYLCSKTDVTYRSSLVTISRTRTIQLFISFICALKGTSTVAYTWKHELTCIR